MQSYFKTTFYLLLAFMLTACSGDKKIRDFVEAFATAVNNHDKQAIEQMYPAASKVDSLSPIVIPEEPGIEQAGNIYVVKLDSTQNLMIKESEDASLSIIDSHGIFAYRDTKMAFARATGWIKEDMSDIQIAENFADTLFLTYIADKLMSQMKSWFTITDYYYFGPREHKSNYEYAGFVATVTNNSDMIIQGTDYEVVHSWYAGTKRSSGKDIRPTEHIQFITEWYHVGEGIPSSKVDFTISKMEALEKYFKPTGNDYENYLRVAEQMKEKMASKSSFDELMAQTAERRLSENDLDELSSSELRILRNSIYAHHGYIFKKQDMSAFFSKKDWYEPTTGDMATISAQLNSNESYNIRFIQQHE